MLCFCDSMVSLSHPGQQRRSVCLPGPSELCLLAVPGLLLSGSVRGRDGTGWRAPAGAPRPCAYRCAVGAQRDARWPPPLTNHGPGAVPGAVRGSSNSLPRRVRRGRCSWAGRGRPCLLHAPPARRTSCCPRWSRCQSGGPGPRCPALPR